MTLICLLQRHLLMKGHIFQFLYFGDKNFLRTQCLHFKVPSLAFSFKSRLNYHCFFMVIEVSQFSWLVRISVAFPFWPFCILSPFLNYLCSSFLFLFPFFKFFTQEQYPFCPVFACECVYFCWQLHLAFPVEFCKGI